MTPRINRWPTTPAAWGLFVLLAALSLAAGFVGGFLTPLLWMIACTLPG